MTQKFITTAIDYVNSVPHIGTAYEKIGADILARFYRLLGEKVLFQMGNDEHSLNVKKSAESQDLDPKTYCDEMRPKFEEVWKELSISNDLFIQTSDPQHHLAVRKLFEKIYEAGFIYEGEYEGLYCESCEAFYTEKDLTEDGLCPQHQKKPAFIKETNYFFKLSAFEDKLLDYIEKNPNFILPALRRNEIVNVIKGGLRDLSVSRSGFDWGIPLSINESHVVYVWFDALINYLTLIGYAEDEKNFNQVWPASMHIIGKDITRFHCVIWPAMLMAADLELPKMVFGHGFVYLKGEKMSKSLGNVVQPLDVAKEYGADALRYYLMRTSSFGDDGNFTWDDFINKYNSDLANGFGNLVSRTAGMINKYFPEGLEIQELSGEDQKIADQFEICLKEIKTLLDPIESGDILFHRALEKILAWISEIDRYIDNQAPWTLAKEKNTERLSEVLTTIVKSIYYINLLFMPFIPETTKKVWPIFGWGDENDKNFTSKFNSEKIKIEKPKSPLFPRIEVKSE